MHVSENGSSRRLSKSCGASLASSMGIMKLKLISIARYERLVKVVKAQKQQDKCRLCLTDFHACEPRRRRMERVCTCRHVHFLFVHLFSMDCFSRRRLSLVLHLGVIYSRFPLWEPSTCQMLFNWKLGLHWTTVTEITSLLNQQLSTYAFNMTDPDPVC